jgi:V8-like Glu-specific endopeptidase
VLFGLLNTAQTYPNWSRLVSFVPSSSVGDADAESICSGTLVGPHHVVSAAHCIYRRGQNGGSWIQPALRVGRNGTGWITDADTSVPSRWFWVEAAYKSAADNNSSLKEWDFGLIMPWDRNIGGPVGWFGWMYSNTSHDDMYNRGYPHCSPDGAPPPANCQPGHLYGDLNLCRTDYFSSDKDSSGYRLLGYHSCDTSGGQSGSSLYRFWPERNAWVVRGVHKGATHHATNDDDFDPNQSFALVTRDRSAWISYFRSAYP